LPDAGEALILWEGSSFLAAMLGWIFEKWEMTGQKWLSWNNTPG